MTADGPARSRRATRAERRRYLAQRTMQAFTVLSVMAIAVVALMFLRVLPARPAATAMLVLGAAATVAFFIPSWCDFFETERLCRRRLRRAIYPWRTIVLYAVEVGWTALGVLLSLAFIAGIIYGIVRINSS